MADKLWQVTVSSLFPNDHRVESVFEGRHDDEAAARNAALRKEGTDNGGSTISTVVTVKEIA